MRYAPVIKSTTSTTCQVAANSSAGTLLGQYALCCYCRPSRSVLVRSTQPGGNPSCRPYSSPLSVSRWSQQNSGISNGTHLRACIPPFAEDNNTIFEWALSALRGPNAASAELFRGKTGCMTLMCNERFSATCYHSLHTSGYGNTGLCRVYLTIPCFDRAGKHDL